ncbi:hypothetical protein [Veillonella sp. 3310]
MLQESVYVKLVLNTTSVKLLEKQLREHKPVICDYEYRYVFRLRGITSIF